MRKNHSKIISKLDIDLSVLLGHPSYDCSLEYFIGFLGEELLKSLNSHAISGLSTVLLLLLRAYPKARVSSGLNKIFSQIFTKN